MFICQTGFFAISSKQNQNINIYFIPTKKQKGAKAEAFLFQENLFFMNHLWYRDFYSLLKINTNQNHQVFISLTACTSPFQREAWLVKHRYHFTFTQKPEYKY